MGFLLIFTEISLWVPTPLYKASQVDSFVEGFHSCSYIYTNVLQGSVDVNFL